jgi:hypothetical protein
MSVQFPSDDHKGHSLTPCYISLTGTAVLVLLVQYPPSSMNILSYVIVSATGRILRVLVHQDPNIYSATSL